MVIAACASYLCAQQAKALPNDSQTESFAKIVEGVISSVDIENNTLVMSARITQEDTIHLDKNSIIKAESTVSDRKDLNQSSIVTAQYEIKNGAKLATVVVKHANVSFLPDTTGIGENVLIAEGTIHYINPSKTFMVIAASLEREYIFSLDSTSIIKSGKNPAALKDLKPRYTAKVGYSEKGSRKTVSSIILKP